MFIFFTICFILLAMFWLFGESDEKKITQAVHEYTANLTKQLMTSTHQAYKDLVTEYQIARASGDPEKEKEAFEKLLNKFQEYEEEIATFDYEKMLKKQTKNKKKNKTKEEDIEKEKEKEANSSNIQDKIKKDL